VAPLILLAAFAAVPLVLRDISGVERYPLQLEKRELAAVFFVTTDCPIANGYAREIRRICADYSERGLRCSLVYVDPRLTDRDAARHAASFGHEGYPIYVDREQRLIRAAGAAVTPEAAVFNPGGEVVYRGRIDNLYFGWGKARRVVTEHNLRDSLDALFSGRPAPKREVPAIGCYIADLVRSMSK
jgi:hypothetical protein